MLADILILIALITGLGAALMVDLENSGLNWPPR